MAPLVSAILPVHNRSTWVARAITSVLEQHYEPVELIVVDDGSTDDTTSVLEGFGSRVRLLRQERAGPYPARNLALEYARGEFVAFIDSDDCWYPDRLSRQVPLLDRPDVGLVFGDAALVTGVDGRTEPLTTSCFRQTTPYRGRAHHHFVWGNFVPMCTVLVRREIVRAGGGFDSLTPLSCDYLKWFRVAKAHELDFVDGPVAEYTVHALGISSNLDASLRARIELFSRELAVTADAESREILAHLLFNLGMHLWIAAARGRARPRRDAIQLAKQTMAQPRRLAQNSGPAGLPWMASFGLHQLRRQVRRHTGRLSPAHRVTPR